MSDIWDEPETRAWVKHCLDTLAPMIEESSVTISLVPRHGTDVKFAVELGFSIMYDKPIILVIQPGAQIPDHLVRVADEIVEMDLDHPERIPEAIDRVVRRLSHE